MLLEISAHLSMSEQASRCRAVDPAQPVGEMALIRKAGGNRNLSQRPALFNQTPGSAKSQPQPMPQQTGAFELLRAGPKASVRIVDYRAKSAVCAFLELQLWSNFRPPDTA